MLRDLTSNLKASVRTRHGNTRDIDMEIGGRQGSKLTGRMFSKLMDLLAEESIDSNHGITIDNDFIIGILLWMDDVVSCRLDKIRLESPEEARAFPWGR